MERRRPDATADERAVLTGWLGWQHQTVQLKCEGVPDADAYRAPLPTSPRTSIAGVVAHLAVVERGWLEGSFLGAAEPLARDPGDGWDVEGQPLADLLHGYDLQWERSQQILREHDLDELEAHVPPGCARVSLRWIVTHLVEETGRHLGHLDLLREMVDGSRGQ